MPCKLDSVGTRRTRQRVVLAKLSEITWTHMQIHLIYTVYRLYDGLANICWQKWPQAVGALHPRAPFTDMDE